MKKLKYLLLLLLIFNFAACNYEIEEIKRNVRLEEISVVLTEDAQRTYYEGQKFTDKGIEVWEHYSDGTVQKGDLSYAKIDDDALYAALDKKEDSAEIKVNYYGLTTSFTVNVGENAPQELVILNYPYKMIYDKNQTEFESAGLEVGIKWRNGSIQKLADEDFTAKLKDKNVFVSTTDNSKSVDFEIRRSNLSVANINIEDLPNRLTYRAGDKIDFTGLQYSAIKKESKGDNFQTVATFQEDSVNISPKSIPETWTHSKFPVTININNVRKSFDLFIVGSYFDHAYLDNEKRVYLGEEKNFNEFNFKEVDTNGDEIDILNDDKSNLKYSVNTNVGFNSANAINVPYTFNAEGLCTVYFYYKYKINKDVDESYTPTYTWSEQFQVLPPVLEKITAAFTYKKGISSIPLESSPDVEFEKNYGTWTITGSYTDSTIHTKHSLTIQPNECDFSIISNGLNLDDMVYQNDQTVPVSITYTDKIYNKSYTASVNITYTKPILRNIEVPDSKIKLKEYETDKYSILESKNFTAVYSNGKTKFTKFEFKNSTPTVGLNYYEIKEVGGEKYIKVLLDIESVQEYQAEPTEQTGTGTQPQGE